MQRYLDALPFASRQLDIGDEQESHNQDAEISAVQVQDSYRQLLVCSCRHMILNFRRIWEIGINKTLHVDFFALWIATSG